MFSMKLKSLCRPAYLYFVISTIFFVISILQNLGNVNKYNIGSLSMIVPSTIMVFVIKFLFILFWTWVLNLLCKDNLTWISWFLVIFPYIIFFTAILFIIANVMNN
jgi:hypothetical protein